MNLIKRNADRMPALHRLFFDDVFGRDLFNWENSNFSNTSTTLPSVNIKETAEQLGIGSDAVRQQTSVGMRALTDHMLGGKGRVVARSRALSRRDQEGEA